MADNGEVASHRSRPDSLSFSRLKSKDVSPKAKPSSANLPPRYSVISWSNSALPPSLLFLSIIWSCLVYSSTILISMLMWTNSCIPPSADCNLEPSGLFDISPALLLDDSAPLGPPLFLTFNKAFTWALSLYLFLPTACSVRCKITLLRDHFQECTKPTFGRW